MGAFETKCSSVDLTVKTIVDKEQCQDITRTVCTVSDEVVENNICVYSYEKQSEFDSGHHGEGDLCQGVQQAVRDCVPARAGVRRVPAVLQATATEHLLQRAQGHQGREEGFCCLPLSCEKLH